MRKASEVVEHTRITIDDHKTRRRVNSDVEWMTEAAGRIVGDPSSWTVGSEALSDFVAAASRLGLESDPLVLEFRSRSIDLLTFSTQWVSTLSRTEQEALSRNVFEIVGELRGGSLLPSQRTATYRNERVRSEASHVISSVLGSLSEAEANEFGQLYADLVDTFGRLVVMAEKMRSSGR